MGFILFCCRVRWGIGVSLNGCWNFEGFLNADRF